MKRGTTNDVVTTNGQGCPFDVGTTNEGGTTNDVGTTNEQGCSFDVGTTNEVGTPFLRSKVCSVARLQRYVPKCVSKVRSKARLRGTSLQLVCSGGVSAAACPRDPGGVRLLNPAAATNVIKIGPVGEPVSSLRSRGQKGGLPTQ